MTLKFYESPFHVTHSQEIADKMAMKMDLEIISSRLKETAKVPAKQSGSSELANSEIETVFDKH